MKIQLKNQEAEVVLCDKCSSKMVNVDVDKLAPGDLKILKQAKVLISNPETEDPICLNCEYETFGRKVADYFGGLTNYDDDDDDSGFFSGGSFGGGSSFGGFGGGSFGGGGATRGF